MSGKNQNIIRSLLRRKNRGMTVTDIQQATGISSPGKSDKHNCTLVRIALYSMPDAYISDWTINGRGKRVPLWSVVVPPPPAPEPEGGQT